MTTYTLTSANDSFNGGSGTDIFQGTAGGANDILKGNSGNDLFFIQQGQTGIINGGAGNDLLHLIGNTYNELDANLNLLAVEELIIDATNLYATALQLRNVTHFGINNSSDQFSLFLQGQGGSLDFSTSFTEPQRLSVEAEMATSAVNIVGSVGNNFFIGSDFNDQLKGGAGNDTAYGGFGNDYITGGVGRDYLYGDDGRDNFVFDAAAGSPNFDHIGDFRPADDTIRIDNAVFSWVGQTTGTIKANEFKIIGTGLSVDADDRILYNQNTGYLYYDPDGNKAGGVAAVAFAVADNFSGDVPLVTFHDIVIF